MCFALLQAAVYVPLFCYSNTKQTNILPIAHNILINDQRNLELGVGYLCWCYLQYSTRNSAVQGMVRSLNP
jgi:hypothetical protein